MGNTEMVFIDAKVLRQAAKRKHLTLGQLATQCGRNHGYFFEAAIRGKANRQIVEMAQKILKVEIIVSTAKSDRSEMDQETFRRMRIRITDGQKKQVVECMLLNKSTRETAKEVGVSEDSVKRIFDAEQIADMEQRENFHCRKFRPRIIRTNSGMMYTGVESRWKLQEAK